MKKFVILASILIVFFAFVSFGLIINSVIGSQFLRALHSPPLL